MLTFDSDQIEELRGMCAALSVGEEAGLTYILMEKLRLAEGSAPETVDALLSPQPRDGYSSRLFFAERVTFANFPSPNWNADGVRILEKNWHAISWKINQENLRLAQMVADHLRPHA
jgi:hypothetical protein